MGTSTHIFSIWHPHYIGAVENIQFIRSLVLLLKFGLVGHFQFWRASENKQLENSSPELGKVQLLRQNDDESKQWKQWNNESNETMKTKNWKKYFPELKKKKKLLHENDDTVQI